MHRAPAVFASASVRNPSGLGEAFAVLGLATREISLYSPSSACEHTQRIVISEFVILCKKRKKEKKRFPRWGMLIRLQRKGASHGCTVIRRNSLTYVITAASKELTSRIFCSRFVFSPRLPRVSLLFILAGTRASRGSCRGDTTSLG